MNFTSLLRAFQSSKLSYRATYSIPLVRRISCSNTDLKQYSFHDHTNKDYTTIKTKEKNNSTDRWISFQRKYCSSYTNDSRDEGLENEEGVSTEQEHPNRRTIFVGSLNYLTDEEKVRKHFSMYGEVEHVRVIRYTTSSIPKNYAFVLFKSSDSIEKALEGKNFLDSRWLEVARHDRDVTHERKIHVRGIASELEVKYIKEYFSQYGDVKSIDIPLAGKKRRDYGFVEFLSENSVIKALQQPSHEVKGHAIQVSTCIAKRRKTIPGKVVVDLLPDNVSLEDVKTYFEQFGQINSIDMVYKRDFTSIKNFAFLCFQNEEVAEEVSNSQKSHYIDDQKVIVKAMHSTTRLRPASSREKKVFVEGIPLGKTEDEILEYFNQFGEAIHLHLIDSWAERQINQCGIVRFKRKNEVDTLIATSELLMEGSPIRVLRLGFTAETSSEYTPLYSEFRRKHQMDFSDTYIQEDIDSKEEMQGNSLNQYPNID